MLGSLREKALNAAVSSESVRSRVNEYLSRYGELRSLRYDRDGFHADLRFLGSSEDIKVSVRSVCLSDDCDTVRLEHICASMPWCEHILKDLVEGREFVLPQAARVFLKPVKKLLQP